MTKEKHPFDYHVGNTLSFGVTRVPGGVQFAVYLPDQKKCLLKLYRKGGEHPEHVLELTSRFKKGSAYFVTVAKSEDCRDCRSAEDILTQDYEYLYEAEGREFVDPYADYVTGRDGWGRRSESKPQRGGHLHSGF